MKLEHLFLLQRFYMVDYGKLNDFGKENLLWQIQKDIKELEELTDEISEDLKLQKVGGGRS